MSKAIFLKEFNYTPQGAGISWNVKPLPKPQTYPKALIAAAVAGGFATEVTQKSSKKSGS